MSTMFLKQHSAVDVVCGLILSVVLDLLVRRWNPGLGLLRLVGPAPGRRKDRDGDLRAGRTLLTG